MNLCHITSRLKAKLPGSDPNSEKLAHNGDPGYKDYIGYILGLYWGYIGIMEKKLETTI